jgi:DNA modification methylase
MPVVNRFNRLSSKEWLPFQKSWFRVDSDEKFYRDFLRFFCKADPCEEAAYYYGQNFDIFQKIANDEGVIATEDHNFHSIQYVFIDLRYDLAQITYQEEYEELTQKIRQICETLDPKISHRRFITILVHNQYVDNHYCCFAYDLAYRVSGLWSLKDEKIACITDQVVIPKNSHILQTSNHTFYALQFRKDELSSGSFSGGHKELHNFDNDANKNHIYGQAIPQWYILKPQPRKKNEILHPAKYPEELVEIHLKAFTNENDNVLDPMSGTGSTIVAALNHNRNGYGTELSKFFADIARERCQQILHPHNLDLFKVPPNQKFKIICKDARHINKDDFPEINYMITSPPYWDMLNMKGAENQAKRITKGLQTNYSDNKDDLGNIDEYDIFLKLLMEVYHNILEIVPTGTHFTIVVKNIKKKGKNYPFAWDITRILGKKMEILPETFWCQDDINLAPYGYGNTFVSNTFHQYCLNFRKK